MNTAGFLFDNSRFNLHNSCFSCQDTLVDAGAQTRSAEYREQGIQLLLRNCGIFVGHQK